MPRPSTLLLAATTCLSGLVCAHFAAEGRRTGPTPTRPDAESLLRPGRPAALDGLAPLAETRSEGRAPTPLPAPARSSAAAGPGQNAVRRPPETDVSSPFDLAEGPGCGLRILGGRPGPRLTELYADPEAARADATERYTAARHATEWLVRTQDENGRWGAAANEADDVLPTALATCALLATGCSLTRGRHKGPVRDAVNWLIGQQDADTGRIGSADAESLLPHAVATLALTVCYRVDYTPALRKRVLRATDVLLRERSLAGPWLLRGTGAVDTEATAWALWALASVDRIEHLPSGRFEIEGFPDTLNAVPRGDVRGAAAQAIALSAWAVHDGDEVRRQRRCLLAHVPSAPLPVDANGFELLGRSMHEASTPWRLDSELRRRLTDGQLRRGPDAGSWDPAPEDRGRVEATGLRLLALAAPPGSIEAAAALRRELEDR